MPAHTAGVLAPGLLGGPGRSGRPGRRGLDDPLRVAVLPDFREEGWPSMDRVADELLRGLTHRHAARVHAVVVRPPFRSRAARVCNRPLTVNVDRGLNRFVDYPRHLARQARLFDVFHVVDHSYAQLVHRVPAERTVVTCHDLDAFRAVLAPGDERRSWPFRVVTRHVLDGLRRAARVTCDTCVVRDELVGRLGLRPDKVAVVPVGVSDVFLVAPDDEADRTATRLLGSPSDRIELLHVGGVGPRKRLDVLLACVARVGAHVPNLHLVHVGEPLTTAQTWHLSELGLTDRVTSLVGIDDAVLSAIYRRAALVLVPSEREGFGLPVAESLASGTPVVASDLPVLREVGGSAVAYCPVGDLPAWTRTVLALLGERTQSPERWADRREHGARWAMQFTWARFADRFAAIYDDLARACAVVDRSVSAA